MRLRCFHTDEASAAVAGMTKDPTCTEKGETTYTAVFDVEWASQQTKTVADVQEKGHGEPELQNAEDATCTAEGYTGDRVPGLRHGYRAGHGDGKDGAYLSGRRGAAYMRRRPRL